MTFLDIPLTRVWLLNTLIVPEADYPLSARSNYYFNRNSSTAKALKNLTWAMPQPFKFKLRPNSNPSLRDGVDRLPDAMIFDAYKPHLEAGAYEEFRNSAFVRNDVPDHFLANGDITCLGSQNVARSANSARYSAVIYGADFETRLNGR